MSERTVILSTLFLDRPPRSSLPVLSAHSFAINWQLLFLNQWKRKNGRKISSWPNLHQRMCRTRGSIALPLDSQATSQPTELLGPAFFFCESTYGIHRDISWEACANTIKQMLYWWQKRNMPRHEKPSIAYAKTKIQVSCAVTAQLISGGAVTAQLISAFVFVTLLHVV